MMKLNYIIIAILFLLLALGANLYAPYNVESTLKKNGYVNIVTSRSWFDFHFDWCGKNAIRINFNATKNGSRIKGYACAYSFFSNGIYEESKQQM